MKRVPWNKGKRGLQVAWNKGLTKEDSRVRKYVENSIESRRGRKLSEEHKRNIGKAIKGRPAPNKGIPASEETKKKLSKLLSGTKNPFYGKTHSEETKRKVSKSRKGKCVGKNHPTCKYYLNYDKETIVGMYCKGYSAKKISKKYKVSDVTILTYLKKWKIPLRKSFYGKGIIICKDGHKVRSYPELLIDNFLYFNGIKHKSNEKVLDTRYMYDFYIPELNLYIEYWGIEGSQTYCKRRDKKLKIYEDNNLNLVSIRPTEDINKKLGFLIPLCAEKQKTIYT